jgi:hypothetical protein
MWCVEYVRFFERAVYVHDFSRALQRCVRGLRARKRERDVFYVGID